MQGVTYPTGCPAAVGETTDPEAAGAHGRNFGIWDLGFGVSQEVGF